MELKYRKITDFDTELSVLIVPLWNWNRIFEPYDGDVKRSNRTFMELK